MIGNIDEFRFPGELRITQESTELLTSTAKWARLISYVGFTILGLTIIGILGLGLMITSINYYEMHQGMYPYNPGYFSWSYAVISILVVMAYGLPLYYLYKFGTRIRRALILKDNLVLIESLRSLHKFFLIIGSFTLIWICCVIIGLLALTFTIIA